VSGFATGFRTDSWVGTRSVFGEGYLDVAIAGPNGVDVLFWVPPKKNGH
jgi:hypothetical protein